MMKNKLIFLFFALLVLAALAVSYNLSIAKQPQQTYYIPDTPEAREIMRRIEEAGDIEAEAAHTFDITKFSTVFINDPRYPLKSGTLKTVRELTDNLSLETAGYLDYKVAYHTWANNAILHAEAVRAKAATENRDLTSQEVQSLIDKYRRMAPARLPTRAPGETRKSLLRFMSVIIDNDVATVVLDNGPATFEMNLVFVDGNWYIAGIGKTISIHP